MLRLAAITAMATGIVQGSLAIAAEADQQMKYPKMYPTSSMRLNDMALANPSNAITQAALASALSWAGIGKSLL
jgi:hypothetical protein